MPKLQGCDHETRLGEDVVECVKSAGHDGAHLGEAEHEILFHGILVTISSVEWNDAASTCGTPRRHATCGCGRTGSDPCGACAAYTSDDTYRGGPRITNPCGEGDMERVCGGCGRHATDQCDRCVAHAFDAGIDRGLRAAVSNPQNIVEPTPLGRKIREAFAEPGRVFHNVDYSQLEMRMHAHYHNDLPEECKTRCPLGGTKRPCASCPHGRPEGR